MIGGACICTTPRAWFRTAHVFSSTRGRLRDLIGGAQSSTQDSTTMYGSERTSSTRRGNIGAQIDEIVKNILLRVGLLKERLCGGLNETGL